MTTNWIRRLFRTDSTRATFAVAATLTLLVSMGMSVFSAPASAAAVLSGTDHIGICHHDNGKPVYNFISPNIHAIVVGPNGHATHADDIIPAFDYDLGKGVQHFAGVNTGLLPILAAGCNAAAATATTPGTLGTIASTCSSGTASAPAYTVPSGPTGVTYAPPVGTTATPGSTVSVTATANAGYVLNLPGGGTGHSVVLTVVIPALASCGGGGGGGAAAGGVAASPENLGVSKTGTGSAKPGDELVWSIVVTNTQGTPATGFTVTDALPTGVSFSLAEGDHFGCSQAAGVISCTYNGTLPVGQTATIAVRGLLDSTFTGTAVSNTAVVDPGRADANPADNSSTAVTGVTPVPAPPASTFTGGGGGATVNPPAKKPAATSGGGAALPFTGSHTAQFVQTGLGMLLLGWFLVALGRRRAASE